MGKTVTNVEKLGKQLSSLKNLTLTNMLFYGEHLFVRNMLPAKTMLDSLTIIAEKRKSQMAYQCKSGEDFERPSISNIINKEFTHFIKETTIRLNDDWLIMDVHLDGQGFSQIRAGYFQDELVDSCSRSLQLSVDEMKSRFKCVSSKFPEFKQREDGTLEMKNENDSYEFVIEDVETGNTIRIVTQRVFCSDTDRSEMVRQALRHEPKK